VSPAYIAIGPGLALGIVQTFLGNEFLGGRHARRVNKISVLKEKE